MNCKATTTSLSKGERGNCLAAALASILDLKISEIPKFEIMCKRTWKSALHEWSTGIGVMVEFTKSIPAGFCIGIGRHASGELHAVILLDGAFYFDTNGTNAFYEEHKYCLLVSRK